MKKVRRILEKRNCRTGLESCFSLLHLCKKQIKSDRLLKVSRMRAREECARQGKASEASETP